jgi:arginase
MNTINLFVPQWQGSGISAELYNGAGILKEYFEKNFRQFCEIDISLDTPLQTDHNILAYRTIIKQLKSISTVLQNNSPDVVFTVGGGCGIEIPIVSYLSSRYEDMDIIWFDAHGDLNTPESSPSKYFHGMPLRFLLEDIPGNDISSCYNRIACKDVILVGSRDLDKAEEEFINENHLKLMKPGSSDADPVDEFKKLQISSNRHVYLHIDLDVLDPGEYKNVKCPSSNGYSVKNIARIIRTIRENRNIVGMSLLENTEENPEKLRILDELLEQVKDIFPS